MLGGFFSNPQNPVDTHQHGSPFLLHLRPLVLLTQLMCFKFSLTVHNPQSLSLFLNRIAVIKASMFYFHCSYLCLSEKNKRRLCWMRGSKILRTNSKKLRIPYINYHNRLKVPWFHQTKTRQILGCSKKRCSSPRSGASSKV